MPVAYQCGQLGAWPLPESRDQLVLPRLPLPCRARDLLGELRDVELPPLHAQRHGRGRVLERDGLIGNLGTGAWIFLGRRPDVR